MLKRLFPIVLVIIVLAVINSNRATGQEKHMGKTKQTAKLDRSKPPKPGKIKTVLFPRYFEKELENGFKFFVVENHEQPIISMNLVVRTGSTYDAALPGLASVTAELLTKGTKTRTATQIAEEIDFVGGSLSSSADWDASRASVTVLKKHLDVGLSILSDVVLNPTFPDSEIARVRDQRLASLKQSKAEPSYLADTRMAAVVFGNHPYGNPAGGTEKSVTAMNRSDFLKFHTTAYLPNNAFIVVAGDITPAEVVAKIESAFGSWQRATAPVQEFPVVKGLNGAKVAIVDKAGAVQSAIRVAHLGIAKNDKDFIKLNVLNTLFGGYFNSRINLNLREKHGYTYGATSIFDARKLPGPFVISVDVRNEVTDSAIVEILEELKRLQDEPISSDELKMVKNYLIGMFPLQIETPAQVAAGVINIELYGLPKSYYNTYRTKVGAITSRDLQAAAGRYVHPENIAIVISGNSEAIKAAVNKFGPVEIFNADGEALLGK